MKNLCKYVSGAVASLFVVATATTQATAQPIYRFSTVAGSSSYYETEGLKADVTFRVPRAIAKMPGGGFVLATVFGLSHISAGGLVTKIPVTTQVSGISAIDVDSAGNLYLMTASALWRRHTDGTVVHIAGHPQLTGAQDGTGDAARFNFALGIVVDGDMVYVADTGNHAIRRVVIASGVVTTVVGQLGQAGTADSDLSCLTSVITGFTTCEFGPGSGARLNSPSDVAIGLVYDNHDNSIIEHSAKRGLFIADSLNHAIRVSHVNASDTPNFYTYTYAGKAGEAGLAEGYGSSARFLRPTSVAVVSDHVLVADRGGSMVRQIDKHARGPYIFPQFSHILAGGIPGYLNGPQPNTQNGVVHAPRMNDARDLIAEEGSNTRTLYVVEGSSGVVRSVTSTLDQGWVVSTLVSTFAGRSSHGAVDGPGHQARFRTPNGIAVAPDGTAFVSDGGNNTIRKVTPSGVVSTIAGSALFSGNQDGDGPDARFVEPRGIVRAADGTLYVADLNGRIARLDSLDGVTYSVTTIVRGLSRPEHLAIQGNQLYVWTRQGTASAVHVVDLTTAVVSSAAVPGNLTDMRGLGTDSGGALLLSNSCNLQKWTGSVLTTVIGCSLLQGQYFHSGAVVGPSGYLLVGSEEHLLAVDPGAPRAYVVGGTVNPTYTTPSEGIGSMARFGFVQALGVDSAGHVSLIDWGSIRRGVLVGWGTPAPSSVTQHPANARVEAGRSVVLSIAAAGNPAPTIKWQVAAPGSSTFSDVSDGAGYSGSDTAMMTVTPSATSANGSQYRVRVVNELGTATSNVAVLTVTPATGTITGTITNAATGAPLASAWIDVYTPSGTWVTNAVTNSAGVYTRTGVASGSYVVRTNAGATGFNLEFLNELYDNRPCLGSCDVTTGTRVTVTDGASSTVNFALTPGGRFTGTITNAATGAPLQSVWIDVYTSTGTWIANGVTNSSGVYASTPVPPGTYFIRTATAATGHNLDILNELHAGILCAPTCVVSQGTPVSVTGGALTTVNFDLQVAGRVTGVVRDASGAPIAGVTVQVRNASNSILASAATGADGTYTVNGLAAGSVYVRTSNTLGYIDQLHSGLTCVNCNVAAGTPVTVALGTSTTVDFSLVAGGRITGTVTNASNGAVLASAGLTFYSSQGAFVGTASTNASGVYQSPGLPTGTYYVIAFRSGFPQTLYPAFFCPSCGGSLLVNGTAISVTGGATTPGIDFALVPGGSVTGTVTQEGTSTPVSGVSIRLVDAGNSFVGAAQTNAQGVYTITGVPSGSYYAHTSLTATLNYVGQVYNAAGNLVCFNCNATQLGSVVSVASPGTTSQINFSLSVGGSISGTVVDGSQGNAALADLFVAAYDSSGNFAKSASTNAQGLYTIVGLPAGSYYLRTSTSLYVNQVYPGIVCVVCTVTSGTPVPVSLGAATTGRDFALTTGGRIGGTVTSGATPLSGVFVSFVTSTGASAGSVTTNASGEFLSGALIPGTYFARTSNSAGYVNEVYNDLQCLSCQTSTGNPIMVSADATTSGIHFDLAAGGTIGGTITDAATGDPLAGATASVYTSAGTFVTSASTNGAGVYLTSAGLTSGTYHLYFSATGYVPEVYDDVVCPSCPRHSGTGITVVAGATTSGINAALSLGGRVTGRVVDAAGMPIAGVQVLIVSKTTGASAGSGTTSVDGTYAVAGIAAGSYTARATNSLGYLNEIYDDIRCATCSVQTAGTAFDVAIGATTEHINFALAAGGRITGTVRNADGTPLAAVSVSVHDAQNAFVTGASTNQQGVYTTAGLPEGRYFVRTTSNSGGYINQLFSGIPCRTCSANTGTPVDVVLGATTPDIDFSLITGTSISGTVRDAANVGVANVAVAIIDAENTTVASVVTAANGTYMAAGLTGGVYYARTYASVALSSNTLSLSTTQSLIDRMYNNVVCVQCSVTAGAPITVAVGTPATGIDFTLEAGGAISGTVLDGAGAPIGGVSVEIHGSNGEFIARSETNSLGQYATRTGLTTGHYYVRTSNTLGYLDQVHNNVVCAQCNPLDGAPVAVVAGAVTTGIDFELTTGGRISGTIVAAAGGGIDRVTVTVHTAAGVQVSSALTNTVGQYRTGAVPPGTYYVRTRNTLGYTDEVYNDRECSNCNPTLGNVVVVTGDATTSGIDFALVLGGRISGTVTGTGGAAIAGVTVRVFTSGGVQVTSGTTDGLGRYATLQGLPTGTYYARTANDLGYVDRIYNGVDCQSCAPYTGTPINVTAGTPTPDINFTLTAGGRIAGTIIDATTSEPIVPSFVNVYSSTGVFVTQAVVGSSGHYITGSGLAPGTYFVRAASRLGYISQVWNNVNCSACSAITGTPVTVTADTTTPDINFALVQGGSLSGRVTDADGAPLRNITVQTFNAANRLVTTSFTDAAGQYASASGLPTGTYFVKTLNSQGYIDEVYTNSVCIGACMPNSGLGVAVGAGAVVTGIDFSLAAGGKISGTVTRVSDGAPLSGVDVKVYDSALRVVTTGRTDSAGGYVTTGGLPTGTYYVRTDNDFGFVDEVFNDVPCIACDPRLATGVAVSGSATTPSINFALGSGGGISGTVTAADTGLPLGNVRVALYSSAGSFLGSTVTDGAGRYSGTGVSAGTYFLRTFNLLGYIDEAFEDLACAPCDLLASTGVAVAPGVTATNRNFVLTKGGLISGYVIDSSSGAPILGATVSFFAGSTLVGKAPRADENGYYAISLPVGVYTAQTDAVNGYATSGVSSRLRIGDGPWMANDATGTVSVVLGQETGGVTFGLAACTPPAFTLSSLPRAFAGMAYAAMVTASGGSGTLTFSLTDGLLPAGVSLNGSTGALTGSPTTVGTANFILGVSDAQGCAATQEFAHTTDPGGPVSVAPVITSTPGNETINAGQSTTFTAAATGTPTPTYRWQVSTNGGASFTNLSDVAPYSGALTSTLTITDAPATLHNHRYRVVATNSAGSTNSASATLSVRGVMTVAPTRLRFAATKPAGGATLTSVTAPQTLTVQFAGAGSTWTASTTAPWLQITSGAGSGGGQFSVAVINPGNVIADQPSLSADIVIAALTGPTASVTVPVTLEVKVTTAPPVGRVDSPAQNLANVQGAIAISGWAVDDIGIERVRIYRQCLPFDNPAACRTVVGASLVFLGDASVIPGARPDVEAAFSTLPAANAAGWGFLILSNVLPHIPNATSTGGVGTFHLYAVALDKEGHEKLLGRTAQTSEPTTVTAANDTIAKPFGSIDTPGQGATVSGVLNNFGWVITPDTSAPSTLVPLDGSTIRVYINGASVGTVQYNLCRGTVGNPVPAGILCNDDVSTRFRGDGTRFRNLDAARGPIGLRSIDTSTLPNGLHTISWGVTDSSGRSEGIGSRFFRVLNGGAADPETSARRDRGTSALRDSGTSEPRDPGTPVFARTGYDDQTAFTPLEPNAEGVPQVRIPEHGRVELQIPGVVGGVMIANGEVRDLPIGVGIDRERGLVTWVAGAGYLGTYRLRFEVPGAQGPEVDITVASASTVGDTVRMRVDRADVDGATFTLHGWALDPQASTGAGIETVHVWGRRRSPEVPGPARRSLGGGGSRGSEVHGAALSERSESNGPVFLGVAQLGVARPDVAGAHGVHMPNAGFVLHGVLPEAGEWEITAYVWVTRTGRFEDARTVTVVR